MGHFQQQWFPHSSTLLDIFWLLQSKTWLFYLKQKLLPSILSNIRCLIMNQRGSRGCVEGQRLYFASAKRRQTLFIHLAQDAVARGESKVMRGTQIKRPAWPGQNEVWQSKVCTRQIFLLLLESNSPWGGSEKQVELLAKLFKIEANKYKVFLEMRLPITHLLTRRLAWSREPTSKMQSFSNAISLSAFDLQRLNEEILRNAIVLHNQKTPC